MSYSAALLPPLPLHNPNGAHLRAVHPAGARRTLAWYPSATSSTSGGIDTNVTVTITNVGADFTKLGSFGTPEQFGVSLVNSMDRSYLLKVSKWARGKDPIQASSAQSISTTVTSPTTGVGVKLGAAAASV